MATETRSKNSLHDEKMAHVHDEHAIRPIADSHVTNADKDDTKITWLQIAVVLVGTESFLSSVKITNPGWQSILLAYVVDTLLILGVGAILLPINQAIGPSVQYTWMANGQTVGSAALAPFVGRLRYLPSPLFICDDGLC
jgi:hypothetical protein